MGHCNVHVSWVETFVAGRQHSHAGSVQLFELGVDMPSKAAD